MRRTLALSSVLSLAGCAQIFGLDETSSGGNGDKVSLSLTHASIGASVTMAPLDVSMQTATFLADDGAGGYLRTPGTVTSPGVFSAPELTEAVPVEFTLPNTDSLRIWATGARAQRGTFIQFEHPGAEAPLPSSAIAVMTTLPTPYVTGDSFKVEIIGAWMQHGIGAAEMLPVIDMGNTGISTAAIPYSMYTPIVGNTPARFTSSDVVLFLRYHSGLLTDVLQQQLDQTDGTDTITGAMTAVSTTTSNLMATIDPPGLMTRYTAVRPSMTSGLGMGYTVRAAPGASLGQSAGTVLALGNPAATETSFSRAFGNPFESLGWKSLVEYNTSMSRTYMIDTKPVTLSAALSTIAEVGTDPITFDLPAGLPITIQINTTPLTADGTMIALDLTKPVVIEATADRADNTIYAARLIELDASGTNVVKNQVAEMIVTGTPKFAFPPALFMTGHTYFVEVVCLQGGFEAATSGDLQTVTLPYSSGTLDSGVFTVMP